jgi:hypothetical protein
MRIAARYLAAVRLAGGLGVALMWTTVAANRSNPIRRTASAAQPSAPRGQTTTRLADGRWFIIGWAINGEPMATATIVDTRAGGGSRVVPLSLPRAWHTATVLPDGTVLMAGGLGRGAQVLGAPEIFDPATETFVPIAVAGSAARSGHTATLLTDGRVLVAGGTDADGAAAVPELWTLAAGNATAQGLPAIGARHGHAATLMADGRVLLLGGQDADKVPRADAEVFDPVTGRVAPAVVAPDNRSRPIVVAESRPADGAIDVAEDAHLALRFSRPIATPSAEAIELAGRAVPVRAVPAESGRLLFIWPARALDLDRPRKTSAQLLGRQRPRWMLGSNQTGGATATGSVPVRLVRIHASTHDRKALLLEIRIKSEGFGEIALAHCDERYSIHKAQESLPAIEQQIQSRVVQRFIDPHDIDEGREVPSKASHRIETETPPDERVRFDEDVRGRYQGRLALPQRRERAIGAIVILVRRVEKREERGRIAENGVHPNASSRNGVQPNASWRNGVQPNASSRNGVQPNASSRNGVHPNASSRYRSCLLETSRAPRRSRKRPISRAARSYSTARSDASSESPFSTYRRMISASDRPRSRASARNRRAC